MRDALVDVSISIVNTSNCAMLRDCLASVYEHRTRYSFEVQVVDNASTDGSAEMVRREFPRADLVVNERRLGYAANNNINMRKARGRYLMLLNEDTILLPGCLDAALDFLEATPDYAGVACRMVDPDHTLQLGSTRRLPTITTEVFALSGLNHRFPASPLFSGYTMGGADYGQPFPVELPLEAGMIVRHEIVRRVGYLHEGYFMFGEGPEWCYRIKQAGGRFMYLPRAEIVHFGGSTNSKLPRTVVEGERFRSHYLYFGRTRGRAYALAYRATMVGLHALKLAVHGARFAGGQRSERASRSLALAVYCINWGVGRRVPTMRGD